MELCTPSAISNLPHLHSLCRPSLHLKPTSLSISKQGLHSYKLSSLRSSLSDETSSVTSQFVKDGSDGVITSEDRQPPGEKGHDLSVLNEVPQNEPVGVFTVDGRLQSEDMENGQTVNEKLSEGDSSSDVQKKVREFLDQLNLKLDSEDDTYSTVLFGGTAVTALWFATIVVGVIDSIPLFPKLMEVVGLGYTVWFSTRYLIFKRNRDELVAKIEELKQQVFGLEDD